MKLDPVVLAGLWGAALLPVAAWAATDAPVAQLRQSCPSGTAAAPPCFTTTALNEWIWKVRKPDVTRPLTVEIGAGTYDALHCNGPANGHVTFRGIGMPPALPGEPAAKIRVGDFRKCAALVFENLAFEHLAYEGALRFAADGRVVLNAPVPPSPVQIAASFLRGRSG